MGGPNFTATVRGTGNPGMQGTGNPGVQGVSPNGHGVEGSSGAAIPTSPGTGVAGTSSIGYGVEGISRSSTGVRGQSTSANGTGVRAEGGQWGVMPPSGGPGVAAYCYASSAVFAQSVFGDGIEADTSP